jgi:hypothetical protein
MEDKDERTAHYCDNCQTEGQTAHLDIGKGAVARLCAACWARLMGWRERQNARRQGTAFAILPWPHAGSETSRSARRQRRNC